MIWLLYGLLSAFFESLKDLLSKRGLTHIDEYMVAWAARLYSLPLLIPTALVIGIPPIGNEFWKALWIYSVINTIASVMYMKAIKTSDLSLCVPLVTFSPLFLLIMAPLILGAGEFPGTMGIIGVVLIVVGSYTLNLKCISEGLFAPIFALFREKGPRYMLSVAFLWSIAVNYAKIGMLDSSPVFWTLASNIMIILMMFPIVAWKSKQTVSVIREEWKCFLPIGIFGGLGLIFVMTAMSLTLVTYAISLKRVSTIMSVLWGWLVLKEKVTFSRFIGSSIMVLGVVVIGMA